MPCARFAKASARGAGAGLRVTGISPGSVKTGLADSTTTAELKDQIREKMDEIAIPPDAIARAIAFAIEQPPDVGDIVIRPKPKEEIFQTRETSQSCDAF